MRRDEEQGNQLTNNHFQFRCIKLKLAKHRYEEQQKKKNNNEIKTKNINVLT